MNEWLKLAKQAVVVRRGLKVGLTVGSILTVVNYGEVLISGSFDPGDWWRVVLLFVVPYCASTYAGIDAMRVRT
ncbi:MAG: nitrate/nitrite transporter NrtS [Pseudomonadota bacterium]